VSFKPFPKDRPLRVVQVGCGGMAQGWVDRSVKRKGRIEVVGLVDIKRESAEKTAEKHGLPGSVVYNTLTEALKKAQPDAVFDITIPGAHHAVTLEALGAGCHVLGEKPLAESLPQAREMCAAAQKAQRLYMVTQNRRYIPAIIGFRNALKDGAIGELSSIDADFFIGAHFGGFRDVMPHVLLIDMAIHSFDQGRFISGCDPVSAYCYEYNPKGSWYKQDSAAIVIFEMSNGVVFTYRGSWCAEGFNTSWECSWRAVGSKGTILWDGSNEAKGQRVEGSEGFIRPIKDFAVPSVPIQHGGHDGVLEEFLSSLYEGKDPQTVCTDNIKSLAMCLAAVESAHKKQRVKVEW